jgi:formylglycine-generating enzyme required for sulfatase activity
VARGLCTWRYAGQALRLLWLPIVAGLLFSCSKEKVTGPGSEGAPGQMVPLAAGVFQMGSPSREPGHALNEARHEVTLTRAFMVGNGEVTQDEWQGVMGWNDSFWKGGNLPAEGLTWFDAVDYCNRRSLAEGLTPAYVMRGAVRDGVHLVGDTVRVSWNREADGYRLLTEAEWEYACRAGSDSALAGGAIEVTDNTCKPDSVLLAMGWYCGNAGRRTHYVRQKAANAWGLYDFHGNVAEWCWDVADSVYNAATTDPTGAVPRASYRNRSVRGGSWGASPTYCRSSCRAAFTPITQENYIGLRVARARTTGR